MANRQRGYEIEIPDPEGSGDGTQDGKDPDDDESITDNQSEIRGTGRRQGGRKNQDNPLKD